MSVFRTRCGPATEVLLQPPARWTQEQGFQDQRNSKQADEEAKMTDRHRFLDMICLLRKSPPPKKPKTNRKWSKKKKPQQQNVCLFIHSQ